MIFSSKKYLFNQKIGDEQHQFDYRKIYCCKRQIHQTACVIDEQCLISSEYS